MSGGVDSSVAAYFMKQAGYDCIGVTMKLFHNEDAGVSRAKSCCSLDDVEDARSVAHRLGIPYYVFNFTADFREQVMQRFVCAYESGATPNPCIDCNRYLKFDRLYHRARLLGCDCVVTGHYARIRRENGRFLLQKALDPSKDQSYVLYALTQDELAHTQLPLGGLSKAETRRIAQEQGFFNAEKPDSQDICFVPDGDYAAFIRRFTGKTYVGGDFVDRDGKRLGTHRGIIGYTVGQRRGLGIAAGRPLYVTAIQPEMNRVVLGDNADLFHRELDVRAQLDRLRPAARAAPRQGEGALPPDRAARDSHRHGRGSRPRLLRRAAARHHRRSGHRVLRRRHRPRRRHDRQSVNVKQHKTIPASVKAGIVLCTKALHADVRRLVGRDGAQGSGRGLDLQADAPGAEADRLERLGARVDDGRKLFFHADRAASAVDIARQRQQLLLRQHRDRFFPDRRRSLFQIQLLGNRHKEDIVRAGFSGRDERFEHASRIQPERGRDLRAGERAAVVAMRRIRLLFAFQLPNGIRFVHIKALLLLHEALDFRVSGKAAQ